MDEKVPSRPVVIVTGNGSGIGEAIVRRLEADGFIIYGTHIPGKGRFYDITNESELEKLVKDAARLHDGIYGLVNNAGILDRAEFGELDPLDAAEVFCTNVYVPLQLSEMAVARGCQNIVNISGMYGKTGAFGRKPVYAASKAALNNVTLSLARMLAPTVRVNAVLPGIIPTGIHDDPDRHPPHGHALLQRTGTPEDVAEAVAWLMSDKSSYVTGHLLEVCGGR
jgi:NAD(P)-dependent dehydrogenase (short-subunit alcohol dehydrogenase family)